MFRKSIFAIAAVATIAAASLVPTTADAHYRGGRYWGYGAGIVLAAPFAYNYNCYRWVQTPYGVVKANVCGY
jgi:hypothetical protein